MCMGEGFRRKTNAIHSAAPDIKGDVVTIEFHKTGHKFTLYLFLTEIDVKFCQLYVIIREKYLNSIGRDPMELSEAFFVNSMGQPALGPKVPIWMEDFNRRGTQRRRGIHIVPQCRYSSHNIFHPGSQGKNG